MTFFLKLLLVKTTVVPAEVLYPHREEEALEIVKDIDRDDAVFIGCALAYEDSVIWSNDRKLKKQDKIKVLNTGEIILLIGRKS